MSWQVRSSPPFPHAVETCRGRGHASLLANLGACCSAPVRSIGRLLIWSVTQCGTDRPPRSPGFSSESWLPRSSPRTPASRPGACTAADCWRTRPDRARPGRIQARAARGGPGPSRGAGPRPGSWCTGPAQPSPPRPRSYPRPPPRPPGRPRCTSPAGNARRQSSGGRTTNREPPKSVQRGTRCTARDPQAPATRRRTLPWGVGACHYRPFQTLGAPILPRRL